MPSYSLFKKTYGSKNKQAAARAAVAAARATLISSRRRYGTSSRRRNRGPELKFLEPSGSVIVAGQATHTQLALNTGINQGDDITNRTGRKIMMKSIYVRFNSCFTSTTAGSSAIRIMIVYDKQPNAAQYAVTDLLSSNVITGMINLDNRERFLVLCDQVVPVHSATDPLNFVWYKKVNLPVIYNGTNGGTIADITTGTLTAQICQQNGIITNAPTNTFRARIRFEDA